MKLTIKPNSDNFYNEFLNEVIEQTSLILEDDGPITADAYLALCDLKELALKRLSFEYYKNSQKNQPPNGDPDDQPDPIKAIDSGLRTHNEARDLLRSLGLTSD